MLNRVVCEVAGVLVVACAVACNVSDPAPSTGGVDDDDATLRGVTVVNSDYLSTSVSLVSKSAKVLSEVFIASSSENPGLSTPLSGDVTAASSDARGKELVLIDRSEGVVSWVNFKTAKVRAQLNVSTGFAANPHDYVEIASDKAYVTRYSENGDPGKVDFDAGSDVLIIDPSVPEISGRVDLSQLPGKTEGYLPNADRVVLAGGHARVTLNSLKMDFSDALDARVVSIDPKTDKVVQTLTLKGIKNCGVIAVSPDDAQLALACSGLFGQDPSGGFPDAGVVLLKVGAKLSEELRLPASAFGNAQVSGVSYVDATHLLVTTTGVTGDVTLDDQAIYFDVKKKKGQVILKGPAFTLHGASCIAERCFLADSVRDGGVLHVFELDADKLKLVDSLHTDTITGLPPRDVTRF